MEKINVKIVCDNEQEAQAFKKYLESDENVRIEHCYKREILCRIFENYLDEMRDIIDDIFYDLSHPDECDDEEEEEEKAESEGAMDEKLSPDS